MSGVSGSWGPQPAPPNHNAAWTSERITELVKLMSEGFNPREIAVKLGRSTGAIESQMIKIGMAKPAPGGIGEFGRISIVSAHRVRDAWMGRTGEDINSLAPTGLALFKETQEKKVMDIKMTHLITMLQTGYTTVKVQFSGTDKLDGQQYTYKVKTGTVVVGDTVVVEVQGDSTRLKLAKVVEVHETPQIDSNAPYAYKWIVQVVDRSDYDDQVSREQAALDAMETGKRAAAQATAKEQLQTLVGAERAAAVLAALGGSTLPPITGQAVSHANVIFPDNGYEAGL